MAFIFKVTRTASKSKNNEFTVDLERRRMQVMKWLLAQELPIFGKWLRKQFILLSVSKTDKEQDVGQYWVSISTLVEAERQKEDEKPCQGRHFSGKLANQR